MHLQSAKSFQTILIRLSLLRYVIASNSKRGLTDTNVNVERFFQFLLSKTYGWCLTRLNVGRANHPAIDLGDDVMRVGVQITSDNSSDKIQETLRTFLTHNLDKQYSKLVIFLLTGKKDYKAKFETDGRIVFDPRKHIIDMDDLLGDIEKMELSQLEALETYTGEELYPLLAAVDPTSLLAQVEASAPVPASTAAAFLRFCEVSPGDQEWGQFRSHIEGFFAHLIRCSTRLREFLCLLVLESREVDFRTLEFSSAEVRRKMGAMRIEADQLFRSVSHSFTVGVSEEDRSICYLYARLGDDLNFLLQLKKFVRDSKDMLARALVKLDFSILD